MTALSCLVVSYNVREHLRRCLASVGTAAHVVVVDNASHDGSAEMVRRDFPQVTLVPWPTNRGFSAAVNEAARHARHDALLVMNPDTVLSPSLLQAMAEKLEAGPDIGALGFRQVDGEGRFQLSFGPPPSLLLELGRRFVQRRLDRGDRRVARLLERLTSEPRDVPWVSGAALLTRRDVFTQVGGFDERFFLYFEDIDYCLRVQKAGSRVVYDPGVVLTHLRGESMRTNATRAERAYRDSQLWFWEKHRGTWARRLVAVYLALQGKLPG